MGCYKSIFKTFVAQRRSWTTKARTSCR